MTPKDSLQSIFKLIKRLFYGWVDTKPPKELLLIASAEIGKLKNAVDKRLREAK